VSTGSCLDQVTIEAVAQRVVELLLGEEAVLSTLVDASVIARRFSVSTDYVYRYADDLGVVRLGNGKKARLRFDPAIVRERLEQRAVRDSEGERQPTKRSAVRRMRSGNLLPVKGESL
jgi:hypothetical protein